MPAIRLLRIAFIASELIPHNPPEQTAFAVAAATGLRGGSLVVRFDWN